MYVVLGIIVALLLIWKLAGSDVLPASVGGIFNPTPTPGAVPGGQLVPSLLAKWAEAIARLEGFFQAGSVAQRNNNPGNLKIDGDAGRDARGFAIFSTAQKGFEALRADLAAKVAKYPNYSLVQIMTRYLGGNPAAPAITSEGNSFAYATYVAQQLGVSIEATLSQIFGGKNR